MKLEKLLSSYEINLTNPNRENFHNELILYKDFEDHPIFSIETERKLLNVREMNICKDYNITYLALLRNLDLLERYKKDNGDKKGNNNTRRTLN